MPSIKDKLTPERAVGMTVNERLHLAGLIHDYDVAVGTRDIEAISTILKTVYLTDADIDAIIAFELRK